MYRLTNNQISSELAGQTTILDHRAGVYYGLDRVGTHIWNILRKSPADFDTLKESILNNFAVDKENCMKDLREILSELINAKLIEKI